VFGGMLAATLLAIFIVPVLYVTMQRFSERRRAPAAYVEPRVEVEQ
jgi:Cu/Ag efflux pump CusA